MWLPDRHTDRRTDRQTTDKVIPVAMLRMRHKITRGRFCSDVRKREISRACAFHSLRRFFKDPHITDELMSLSLLMNINHILCVRCLSKCGHLKMIFIPVQNNWTIEVKLHMLVRSPHIVCLDRIELNSLFSAVRPQLPRARKPHQWDDCCYSSWQS